MSANNDELLETAREIRDLLARIYACFEGQYLEIQKQKLGKRLEIFKAMLTPIRKKIYPLLFDPRHLSQVEIAKEASTSQPNVSKFVSALIDQDLIEQTKNSDGTITYHDKYDLVKLL
jgi:hypothetical protein